MITSSPATLVPWSSKKNRMMRITWRFSKDMEWLKSSFINLQEVQSHHHPICHKIHVAFPAKGSRVSVVTKNKNYKQSENDITLANALDKALTMVFSLLGHPKSSFTSVPIFFSSSLSNATISKIPEHLLEMFDLIRQSHYTLPVWTVEYRSEESAINWRLVHNNRIFLVISGIASNRNNGILSQNQDKDKSFNQSLIRTRGKKQDK